MSKKENENLEKSKNLLNEKELQEQLEILKKENETLKSINEDLKKEIAETRSVNEKLFLKLSNEVKEEPKENPEDEEENIDPDLKEAKKIVEENNKKFLEE